MAESDAHRLANSLLDLQVPQVISISPNSRQILYSTAYTYEHEKDGKVTSTIWLAETGKPRSARPLTSGQFYDREPRWSPDGKSIAFLSDREDPGKTCAIYLLPSGAVDDEAYPISFESEQTISRYEFSPDGKHIAFISKNEPIDEREARRLGLEFNNGDCHVWGEWEANALHVAEINTKDRRFVNTIVGGDDGHVIDLAWRSPTELAFIIVDNPDDDCADITGSWISTINAIGYKERQASQIVHLPFGASDLKCAGKYLYFRARAAGEKHLVSSKMVWRVDPTLPTPVAERFAHGETDCAFSMTTADAELVVHVKSGIKDQLVIANGPVLHDRSTEILAWDAAFTADSDEVLLAIATGDSNTPTEVFTTTASGGALIQLSSHGDLANLTTRSFGVCRPFTCRSTDDAVVLDYLFISPSPPTTPAPTVLFIHGGPYDRSANRFNGDYFMWVPLLLANGHAVLLPNYRGSTGRGESFAAYGRAAGIADYADVIACTQDAIDRSLADPHHLLIIGYSQGGYMAFLAAVRNGLHTHPWRFRAAIAGSGVSDSDSLIFAAAKGLEQAEIAGVAPWHLPKHDTRNRVGSAVWEVHDAVRAGVELPPLLMLHGLADATVPVSQSVGMRRAWIAHGRPVEMVTYPREGHIFSERRHMVDMAVRVLRFVEKYL